MAMETSMETSFYMITALVFVSVFVTMIFFGHESLKAAKEKAQETTAAAREAYKRINDLLSVRTITTASVICTKSGGLYKYDVDVRDLAVLFKDKQNPDRKMTAVPVLKYKGVKALDKEKTSATLEPGKEFTFAAGDALHYTIHSQIPPTIFREDEKIFSGPLLLGQSLVLNNVRISVERVGLKSSSISIADILTGSPSRGTCTVSLRVTCEEGNTLLELTSCKGANDCERSIVCNTSMTIRLDERFDESKCGASVPYLDIQMSDEKAPEWNFKEKFIIGFCKHVDSAEDCSYAAADESQEGTITTNYLGATDPFDIDENKFFVDECMEPGQ